MDKCLFVPFAALPAQVNDAALAYRFVKSVAFDQFVADSVKAGEEELTEFQPNTLRIHMINS